jgi:hypothetical protein
VHDVAVRALALLSVCWWSCAPRPTGTFLPATDGAVVSGPDGGAGCSSCLRWGNPKALGAIQAPIVELSGLVASPAQPNVLFAHNDSGDTPRFFAISASDGSTLQEFVLDGATHVDWEDLALGPCATGSCLFLGDIGDNRKARSDYALYRVPEPRVTAGGAITKVPFEKIPYAYPSGEKHNAEALFAHPVTGRLYLISKEDRGQPSGLYRFPEVLAAQVSVTLELVLTLPVPTATDQQLTGVSVSPCADAVLVRLYNRLLQFDVPDGGALEDAFRQPFAEVPVAQEPQGEAVAYAADGRSFFTASEAVVGAPPLYQSTCR